MRRVLAAVVVAVVGGGMAAWGLTRGEAQPVAAAAAVAPTPAAPAGLVVRETRGRVETRRGNLWGPAASGDRLSADDSIRTFPGGSVLLSMGNEAQVQVEERSEISVREVTNTVARLRLERGRIGADSTGNKVRVRVEAANSSVVAETGDGAFTVFNNGKGLVAVAARTGEVKLTASGGETVLTSGQQAMVQADKQPVKETMPSSVFLRVAWPEETETRETQVVVRGQTEPGTIVRVNGVSAVVSAKGTFEAKVPMHGGKNRIEVSARDIFGRRRDEASVMEVIHGPPNVKADSEGLWE